MQDGRGGNRIVLQNSQLKMKQLPLQVSLLRLWQLALRFARLQVSQLKMGNRGKWFHRLLACLSVASRDISWGSFESKHLGY